MQITEFMVGFGVCCVRPAVMLQLLPFGSSASAGTYLRTPLMLVLGWMVYRPGATWTAPLLALVLKEAALGVVLGFLLNRAFAAVGMAGAILAQQAGYTSGSTHDPNFDREASAIESLLLQMLTLLALTPVGLHILVASMAESYVAWPVADIAPDLPRLADGVLKSYGEVLLPQALQLAMPVMVFLLVAEICLGVMGRHAQQLNPYSLAMPVKAGILFAALWVGFGTVVDRFSGLLRAAYVLP